MYEGNGKQLNLILDNSPMNHSKAVKNFCLRNNINLLYTAPKSSYQNPIEYVFAKAKTPLKKTFSETKTT